MPAAILLWPPVVLPVIGSLVSSPNTCLDRLSCSGRHGCGLDVLGQGLGMSLGMSFGRSVGRRLHSFAMSDCSAPNATEGGGFGLFAADLGLVTFSNASRWIEGFNTCRPCV